MSRSKRRGNSGLRVHCTPPYEGEISRAKLLHRSESTGQSQSCEQIRRAIHPHRLRRYVRTLEQRLSARRAPTVVLRLTRPQVEVSPLADFVGDDKPAMRGPPRANRMALSASCSEVKATRRAAGASGYRKSTDSAAQCDTKWRACGRWKSQVDGRTT
jgi:hypothetical protein